jgi:hypothetical protein
MLNLPPTETSDTFGPIPLPTPYESLKGEPAWKVIDEGLLDLEENGDLLMQTPLRYATGYLVKKLKEKLKEKL